jgi:hypothetical protein
MINEHVARTYNKRGPCVELSFLRTQPWEVSSRLCKSHTRISSAIHPELFVQMPDLFAPFLSLQSTLNFAEASARSSSCVSPITEQSHRGLSSSHGLKC